LVGLLTLCSIEAMTPEQRVRLLAQLTAGRRLSLIDAADD
jgi:hypothetical protein